MSREEVYDIDGLGEENPKPVVPVRPEEAKVEALSDGICRHIRKKITEQNKPIRFRDLVVHFPSYRLDDTYLASFGEAKLTRDNVDEADSLSRLSKHIKTLMQLTNKDHQKNCCTLDDNSEYKVNPDKVNSITRLCMNEFSLYSEKALTNEQFKTLMDQVSEYAELLEPNVHIQLGSVGVLDDSGRLTNVTVYIQGADKGQSARIQAISKNAPSEIDVDYDNSHILQGQIAQVAKMPPFASLGSLSDDGSFNSTGSVFEVTTYGGAKCLQAVDICLDHLMGHSLRQVIRDMNSSDLTAVMPLQMQHLVTSNRVDISYDTLLTSGAPRHVDQGVVPVEEYVHGDALSLTRLTVDEMADCVGDGSRVDLAPTSEGYTIVNPEFGHDCEIYVTESMRASSINETFKSMLLFQNITAIYNNTKEYFARSSMAGITDDDIVNCMENIVDELVESDDLDCSEGAFIEWLLLNHKIDYLMKNMDQFDEFDFSQQLSFTRSTPLILALNQGHDALAKFLLSKPDIDINIRDSEGNAALDIAIEKGRTEVAQLLIDKMTVRELNFHRSSGGVTPLLFAIRQNRKEIVAALLEKGVNVSMLVVMKALVMDYADITLMLINRPDVVSGNGRMLLGAAIRHKQVAVVVGLIEKGVDANLMIRDGKTALQLAIAQNDTALIEVVAPYDAGVIALKEAVGLMLRSLVGGDTWHEQARIVGDAVEKLPQHVVKSRLLCVLKHLYDHYSSAKADVSYASLFRADAMNRSVEKAAVAKLIRKLETDEGNDQSFTDGEQEALSGGVLGEVLIVFKCTVHLDNRVDDAAEHARMVG